MLSIVIGMGYYTQQLDYELEISMRAKPSSTIPV